MKVTYVYQDPTDIVVETIGDECIICLNRGYEDEVSHTVNRVNIDVFDCDDDILLGIKNPEQFEHFYEFDVVLVEIDEVDGFTVANVECHYR